MKLSFASLAVVAWVITSVGVFFVLDGIATRRIPIYVEEFRKPGIPDAEAVSEALQLAYRAEPNGWWIRNKRPYLVFRNHIDTYDVHPTFFEVLDIEIVSDTDQTIGLLPTSYEAPSF